jgi:TusA-related sulfurtransferase
MNNQPELVIDAVGRMCPLPVIELAKQITAVPVGAIVAIVSDDPAAATDIPAWCRMREQEYLGEVGQPSGATSYLVRRVR